MSISRKEAAERLGCSETQVSILCKKLELEKVGNSYLITVDDLPRMAANIDYDHAGKKHGVRKDYVAIRREKRHADKLAAGGAV